MPDKPAFDPSKPFNEVTSQEGVKPPFNPNKPFIPVGQKPDTQQAYLDALQGKPEVKDKNIAQVFSDKKEESGLGEDLFNSLARGSARLGSMLAKTPAMIYDIAATPFNYVASGGLMEDLQPLPNKTESMRQEDAKNPMFTSEKLAESLGIKENKVAKYYDDQVKQSQEVAAKKYDKGISEYFGNGEYKKGFGLLANSIAESAPITVSLLMGNAAGVSTVGSILGGGAVFAADKKAELDREAPHLDQQTKMNIAMSNGLFEGIFEQFGITKLGGLTKNILARNGKDEALRIAEEGFKEVYAPVLKKYIGTAAEESLSEAATQFAQNAVDKYSGYKPDLDLRDGVVDAAIIGLGASGVMATPTSLLEAGKNKSTKKEVVNLQKERIEKETERNNYVYDVSKSGDEKIKSFVADVESELASGKLTQQEADNAIVKVNAYKEYHDQTIDLNLPDEEKKQVFDYTFQKSDLLTKLKNIDKDKLNAIELAKYHGLEKQAKDLQSSIDDIILKAQLKNETTISDTTIDKQAKSQQKPSKEEKKPIYTEEEQAVLDKYKKLPETGKTDERTYEEIPLAEFNSEKFNARTKHAKLADYLERIPDKKVEGKLVEKQYVYNNKNNSTYAVQLPDGKVIKLASSMERPEKFRGHMRTEHLVDAKDLVGFPVGVKVEYLPEGKKVIKLYNGKTGKFISWAKETTRGIATPTEQQVEQLSHLETIKEPPISGDETTQQPEVVTPLQPIEPNNVQTDNGKTEESAVNREKPTQGESSRNIRNDIKKTKRITVGTKKANRKIKDPKYIKALSHEVFTPHELAMQYFIGKGLVNSESIKKLLKSGKEVSARMSYVKTDAPTINQIAEKIVNDNESLGLDMQDVVNAVEDIITGHNTPSSMAEVLNSAYDIAGQEFTESEMELSEGAEMALEAGLGDEFDNTIDIIEKLPEGSVIRLTQEDINKIIEENESDIFGDDNEGDQFQKIDDDLKIGTKTNVGIIEDKTKTQYKANGTWYAKKLVTAEKTITKKASKSDIGDGKAAYEKWKGDNKEYEGAEIEDVETGEKVMLTVYHGTTNEFYVFDSSVKGNVEGHLGKVNYFTSDKNDADANYLSEGADLTGRIEQRKERLEQELENIDDKAEIAEQFDLDVKKIKKLSFGEIAKLIAEKELKGGEERVLKVHVKLNNPVVLGKKSQWVDVFPESSYSDYIEDAAQEVADENGIEIDEAKKDYDYEIRQKAIENSYAQSPLLDALTEAINKNDYSGNIDASEVLQDFLYDTQADLDGIEKALRTNPNFSYAEGKNGELVSTQIIADFFQNLGYDGIILTDVSKRFPNMGIGSYTSHVHVFDENSNQIKLADGTNKTFNPDTNDIRYQKAKTEKGNIELSHHEKVLKVVEVMQKALPNIEIKYNPKLKAAGVLRASGKTIEINPYLADTDTPIHEAGHVLIDAMGYDNKVIQAAIKQLKTTELWDKTKARYKELSEEMLAKEVLAEAIGLEGKDIFNTEIEKSKFKQYLDYIFNWFKRKLGMDKNIAKSLAKQIIGGIRTKNITGEKVSADQEQEGEYLELVKGFYSPIEKTLRDFKLANQSATKWLNMFGKGDEMMFTGLRAYLESKKPDEQVKKQELIDFIRNNRIQIKEVVMGGNSEEDFMNRAEEAENKFGVNVSIDENPMDGSPDVQISGEKLDDMSDDEIQELEDEVRDFVMAAAPETKFQKYQLEGEKEGYKEVLITIPSKEKEPFGYKVFDKYGKIISETMKKERAEQLARENEGYVEADFKGRNEYKSSHFDEANIVVHLRMNIRKDADGNKVLFLEEIQSDYGQEGKKKGFKVEQKNWDSELGKKAIDAIKDMNNLGFPNWQKAANAIMEDKDFLNTFPIEHKYAKLLSEWRENAVQEKKLPSAPYVTDTNSWAKLGLKVALQHAVQEGATKIAWTTGEQQNDRYDLSKQVDKIEVEGVDNVDGLHFVDIYLSNGTKENLEVENGTIREGKYSGQRLDSLIGKDYADKVLSTPKGENVTLKGDDLKVGGKGMIGFYGSPKQGSLGIIGGIAEKLFGKGSVKTTEINKGSNINEKEFVSEINNKIREFNKLEGVEVTTTADGNPIFNLRKVEFNGKEYYNGAIEKRGVSIHSLDGKAKTLGREIIQDMVDLKKAKSEAKESIQYSVDVTPEMEMEVGKGLPQFQKGKEKEALKAFDLANSKKGIKRKDAFKELKQNFPNLAEKAKQITDNFKSIVQELKQTQNLIEKC